MKDVECEQGAMYSCEKHTYNTLANPIGVTG